MTFEPTHDDPGTWTTSTPPKPPLTFESPGVRRITEQITPLVRSAVQEHSQGDVITWDCAFQLMPNPQDGSLMGVVAVYAQMPGVLPKSYIGSGIFLQPVIDASVIDQEVRVLLESLRQGRSQQLDSMQQAGEQAARTGRPSPASGLILP